MSIKPAISAVVNVLNSRIGSMANIICEKELSALGKTPDTVTTEDLDAYIMRLVEAISPLMGRVKAHETGNELSSAALGAIYGSGGETGAKRARKFSVVQAFLIYSDGRLLAHTSSSGDSGLDTDIVSSMLTAVQNFVAESLGKGDTGSLDELRYGNTKILIAREKEISMAVVVTGERFEPVRHYMSNSLKEMSSFYGASLKEWNGNMNAIKGLQYYTDVLCLSGPIPLDYAEDATPQGTAPPGETPASAEENAPGEPFSISSEIEFYGGYIRLKTGVKNRMPTVVTNVALRLAYDDTAFRYDRVEPVMDHKGGDIMMGNIGSGEKKAISVYLDPLICMDSYVDGLLTYRDAAGALETVKMKRKLVSVVCPMLFTEGEINVAMLKRMVESELLQQDTRAFRIPTDMQGEGAMAVARSAISRHDMRMVREFRKKGEPFTAEMWFFARIKGREERVVIRLSVLKGNDALELFAASESLLVITGLLAELRHDICAELEKRGLSRETFKQMTEKNTLVEMQKRVPLLMQETAQEISPGETELRR